mgnify:CR=1 FL=1
MVSRLIDLRGGCSGKRNEMLFVVYNAAAQIYSLDKAKTVVEEMNRKFIEPLESDELNTIFASVDNCKNGMGLIGFYPLKNEWIKAHLDLSDEL